MKKSIRSKGKRSHRRNVPKNNIRSMIISAILSLICIIGCVQLYFYQVKQADGFRIQEIKALQNSLQNQKVSDILAEEKFDGILSDRKETLRITEEKVRYLQAEIDLLSLLERKSNEGGGTDRVYDKYFLLRQGELARVEGITDISECGRFGFLNSHFGGTTFEIDEGILVQYGNINAISEYLLPIALIIFNPDCNFGFMGARAGMDFKEIQEKAYAEEISEGFMYNEEIIEYYICYADEFYEYFYCSDEPSGEGSWLMIRQLVS